MAEARIQLRRGTAAEWTSANPILAVGELGFETDTSNFKFGNGSTAWAGLGYASIAISGGASTIVTDNLTASRALASDGSGKVEVSAVTATELGYVSGVTSALQTQLDGKANITSVVDDKTANYTIVAGDVNKLIRLTGADNRTFTIDDVLSVGQRIDFLQDGAGQITFAAGSGATLQSDDGKLKTAAQYVAVSVFCVASGQYRLVGNLSA